VGQIVKVYGISRWAVIALIVMPGLLYTPSNFAAAWFFAHWKIHHVLICAAVLQVVGGWIRALSLIGDEGTYWVLFLGTFIFFVANPFIVNSISIIANMWFADDERARCIAISGLCSPFGSLLGLGLTGVIAVGIDIDDIPMCRSRLKEIIYSQNIIFTVFVLLFTILFREKPETPPSKIALSFRLLS
jgi:hypothetical protein